MSTHQGQQNQPQSDLFKPIKIGGLTLSGRLIKSATVETMCTEHGVVTDELIHHYETIARGGAPLIITGAEADAPFSAEVYADLATEREGCPGQFVVEPDRSISAPEHPGREHEASVRGGS